MKPPRHRSVVALDTLADSDDSSSEAHQLLRESGPAGSDGSKPSTNSVSRYAKCVRELKADLRIGWPASVTSKIVWTVLHSLCFVWIYYSVRISVHPVPRTAANRSFASFAVFQLMLALYRTVLAAVDTNCLFNYLAHAHNNWTQTSEYHHRKRFPWIAWFVVMPTSLFFVAVLCGGPWIITSLAQRHVWDYGCDGYPMYAVLDGKANLGSQDALNVAYFYKSDNPNPLFTYSLTNPREGETLRFNVARWDTSQSDIPLGMYPTLSSIAYDYSTKMIDGNCTVSATAQSDGTPVPYAHCMRGSFDAGEHLSLNITSSVSLNNMPVGTIPPLVTSLLRTQDERWYWEGDSPALILRSVDPITDRLLGEILRTTVKNPNDCTELKVCLSGTGHEGGLVGAQVLAPLGLVLQRQGDYACI